MHEAVYPQMMVGDPVMSFLTQNVREFTQFQILKLTLWTPAFVQYYCKLFIQGLKSGD